MALASSDVKELLLRVDASTELLRRRLTEAEAAVGQFATRTDAQLSRVEAGFGSLGSSLSSIKGLIAGGIAAVAGNELVQLGQRALDYASSLGEVAQQLGVNTDTLQRYRFIASQVGIEQEEMDKGLAKLNLTIGQAADGSKKQASAFNELKISVRDSAGNIRDAGAIMPDLADALSKIEDPAKRARIEVELFGKTGQKLDTLLAGGRGQIDELSAAADRLGVVLSADLINRADEAADKMSAVKQVLEANIAAVVAENADSILKLADAFATLASKIPAAANWLKQIQLRVAIAQDTIGQYTVGLGGIGSGRQRQQVRDRLASERSQLAQMQSDAFTDDLARQFPLRLPGGGATRNTGATNPVSGGSGRAKKSKAPANDNLRLFNLYSIKPDFLADVNAAQREAADMYSKLGIDPYAFRKSIEEADVAREQFWEHQDEQWTRWREKGEAQVQTLARLFEDGFRGGAGSIWRDFKDMGLRVVSEVLARFVASKFSGGGFSLGSAFSSAIGSVFGGAFAGGGDPPLNKISLVGERGPELFVPKVPGTVISNDNLRAGAGGQQAVKVIVEPSELFAVSVVQLTDHRISMAAPGIVSDASAATIKTLSRGRM